MSKFIPGLLWKLSQSCSMWIVGSAAAPGADLDAVRDIDVLIPFRDWQKAAQFVPENARPNTFGGWKFTVNEWTGEGVLPVGGLMLKEVEIDLWPGDLDAFMMRALAIWAWHPVSGIRIGKEQR